MFIVLAIIIVGILIGTRLRSPKISALLSKMLNIIIYLLLLVMGIVVGGNKEIVSNLSTIGLQAFIISAGALVGSSIVAYILYRSIFKNRESR